MTETTATIFPKVDLIRELWHVTTPTKTYIVVADNDYEAAEIVHGDSGDPLASLTVARLGDEYLWIGVAQAVDARADADDLLTVAKPGDRVQIRVTKTADGTMSAVGAPSLLWCRLPSCILSWGAR